MCIVFIMSIKTSPSSSELRRTKTQSERDPNKLHADYMQKMRDMPYLSREEEEELAQKWKDEKDPKAVEALVASHLRLVSKIAQGYRGYGLPHSDLVAEGHVGIMQAMRHFDHGKGFRFATYAMWWIKASMQEYILNAWSLVKVGTTASQKKLFFKLRKIKQRLGVTHLSPEHIEAISKTLDVSQKDVKDMEQRMRGFDHSLNNQIRGSEEDTLEWIEWLPDENDNQEIRTLHQDDFEKKQKLLSDAMRTLSPREYDILHKRRLSEPAQTLESLSTKHNISKERVRQIEGIAFKKLQKAIKMKLFQDAHS